MSPMKQNGDWKSFSWRRYFCSIKQLFIGVDLDFAGFYVEYEQVHIDVNPAEAKKAASRLKWMVCFLILVDKWSRLLGQLAAVWATTILLGGFVSGLSSYDFWVISALVLANATRIFGSTYEHKLNVNISTGGRLFFLLLLMPLMFIWWLLEGCTSEKSYTQMKTLVTGEASFERLLDLFVFLVLQISPAGLSLVYSALRFSKNDFGDVVPNQADAMKLYYGMVLAESSLFLLSKFLWETCIPVLKGYATNKIAARRRSGHKLIDQYFVKLLSVAKERGLVHGLNAELRTYVTETWLSDNLKGLKETNTYICVQSNLYDEEELVGDMATVEERVKLLTLVLLHIRNSGQYYDSESALSAILLVTRLILTKTNVPAVQFNVGPRVLLKALESNDRFAMVFLITKSTYLQYKVSQYLERCLESKHSLEVDGAVNILRFLAYLQVPRDLFVTKTMLERLSNIVTMCQPWGRNTPAKVLLLLKHFGGLISEDDVTKIVEKLNSQSCKGEWGDELEIWVRLNEFQLLTSEHRATLNLNPFMVTPEKFLTNMLWIVQWGNSVGEDTFLSQIKKVDAAAKERLEKLLILRLSAFKEAQQLDPDSEIRKLLCKDDSFMCLGEVVTETKPLEQVHAT